MTASGVENSLLVFAVSLLVGGFGIHIGSKLVLKSRGYSHAVVTALFGALAWAGVEMLFGRIGIGGLLSSLVALLVWIWVIRWRYSVGWIRAGLLAVGAWLGAVLVLFVLAIFGVGDMGALGVPGV